MKKFFRLFVVARSWRAFVVAQFIGLLYLINQATTVYAGTGETGGRVLLYSSGARQLALAEAFTGVGDDINTLSFNPAGLGQIKDVELSAMHLIEIIKYPSKREQDEPYYTNFSFGIPIREIGTVGFGFAYYDGGDFHYNLLGVEGTKKAQQDYLLTLGYGKELNEKLSAGLGLKYLSSELIEEYKAQTLTFDTGLLLKLNNFGIGLSAKNLTGKLKYEGEGLEGEADPLTSLVTVGLSYRIKNFLSAVDIVYPSDDKKLKQNIGLEYCLLDLFSLRAGYRFGYELSSFCFGFGIKKGIFHFDYSISNKKELGYMHRASLSFKFQTKVEQPIVETKKEEVVVPVESPVEISSPVKTTNYLQGRVTNNIGNPIERVVIKVSQNGVEKLRMGTNKDGVYKTPELPFGEYEIKAWEQNYVTEEKKVKVSSDKPAEINFLLRKR